MLNQKNFREAFEPLHASDQTVKEVLNMTQKNEKCSPRWVLRTAIAAMMALVLTVGVMMAVPTPGNAAQEGPREVYENAEAILTILYGEDYDRAMAAKYVTPYIYPVSGTLTYHGYTIELEAAAFDAITGSGLLYYSLEIPEGTKDYWAYANQILDANPTGEYPDESKYPEPQLNHYSSWRLDEANSTETKLYIVEPFLYLEELFTDVEGLNKQAIENGIRDEIAEWLDFYTNDVLKIRFIIPGGGGNSRYMKIPVDPMAGMEWISLDGGNMRLSPLGIQMAQDPYHIDVSDPFHEDRVWEDIFEILDMRIHYADGTELVVERTEWSEDMRKGLYTVEHNKLYHLSGYEGANKMEYSSIFFSEIIDVENVVSIELNGTHYYVDEME